jgi:hypothetical protein
MLRNIISLAITYILGLARCIMYLVTVADNFSVPAAVHNKCLNKQNKIFAAISSRRNQEHAFIFNV